MIFRQFFINFLSKFREMEVVVRKTDEEIILEFRKVTKLVLEKTLFKKLESILVKCKSDCINNTGRLLLW